MLLRTLSRDTLVSGLRSHGWKNDPYTSNQRWLRRALPTGGSREADMRLWVCDSLLSSGKH